MRDFEVTPAALEAASMDRSVQGVRAYKQAVTDLTEWGRAWREIVRVGRAQGLSVEEIAEHTGTDVRDVLVALSSIESED